ncbi:MAG: EcsC family protein [Deltaproteobacteria bacterium]|nr:EcsC family protein [Deltaproteobacteria bacterium]
MNPENYEKEQIQAIAKWKEEKPSVVKTAFGFVFYPISVSIQSVLPRSAIRGVLEGTSTAAKWLADEGDLRRKGEVSEIGELRTKDLRLSDQLANEVHNWAISLASAEGVGSGFLGIYGLAVDIPFIITLALRTIHKIGLCYGYQTKDEKGRNFVLTLLSVAGANTYNEKAEAIKILRAIDIMIAKQTIKTVYEKAVQRQLSKETVLIGLEKLSNQLGINITERKILQTIPVIGAAVGGSVNGWFLNDVGWAARRGYQERWLIENNRIPATGVSDVEGPSENQLISED